ncbi:uncharacterized protein METZ01_LOCUS455660, partial [marine metagenome]
MLQPGDKVAKSHLMTIRTKKFRFIV